MRKKSELWILLLLLGLNYMVGACIAYRKEAAGESLAENKMCYQYSSKEGNALEVLRIDVRISTEPVRMSDPCLVEVQLTNQSAQSVLINRRLAVGYRDSHARELFAEVFRRGSDELVSKRTKLYQRDFSPPDDYVSLLPGQSVSTSFDLFEWYSLPSVGEYELVVFYQADEPLAAKPNRLLTGTHNSGRIAFIVAP